jgi:hypothetical protein
MDWSQLLLHAYGHTLFILCDMLNSMGHQGGVGSMKPPEALNMYAVDSLLLA